MSVLYDSYCGLSCAECSFRETHQCKGCIISGGNPFHGNCEVAKCAIARKKRFCGVCAQIPCELLKRYSDDPEHGDSGARIERCYAIKGQLVAEARVDLNPVGYCGHHCDTCPYSQWCGGCRSDANFCSFATASSDGLCPNAACAQERHLEGCWACPDLNDCSKGYFGASDGYTAKAAALFLRTHDKDTYRSALQQLQDAGQSLSSAKDLEAALALLER